MELVRNPRPPTWIGPRMIAWPKPLQYVPVATTTRPVTPTAKVTMKSAVSGGAHAPRAFAIGSARATAPTTISAANSETKTAAGFRAGRARATRGRTIRSASGRRASR